MADTRKRLIVLLRTELVEVGLPCRQVHPADSDGLSVLMLNAYRDSIDDNGETIADAQGAVRSVLSGEHGDLLSNCSFVALDGDRPVSVTLVTMFRGEPLLAQVYTAPEWKRRGLARALIQLSMNALISRGDRTLTLVVTSGNEPAELLYDQMGFASVQGA